MKFKLFFILVLQFVNNQLPAQELIWADLISGCEVNRLIYRDIKIDKNNNIYVLGITYDTFSPNILNKNKREYPGDYKNEYLFLVKYDEDRNYKWHRIIAVSNVNNAVLNFYSYMDIDKNSNVYIIANFQKTAWLQNSTDTVNSYISNIILVLDSNGQKVLVDNTSDIGEDPSNIISINTSSFLICPWYKKASLRMYATSKDNPDSVEIVQIKENLYNGGFLIHARDKKGVALWYRTLKGNGTRYLDPQIIDNDSNIYLAGLCEGSLFLDTMVLTTKTEFNQFFLKLTKSGKFVSFIDYPTKDNETFYSFNRNMTSFDESNNFYSCYFYEHDINCDPQQNPKNLISIKKGKSMVLSKYSSNGKLTWSFEIVKKLLITNYTSSIKVYKDKIYIFGDFTDSTTIYSRNNSINHNSRFLSSRGKNCGFIAIYNLDGELQTAVKVRPYNKGHMNYSGLDVDRNENIVICGEFTDTIDFDPTNENYLVGSKNVSLFLAKYNKSVLSVSELDTSDILNTNNSSIFQTLIINNKIYPNPFNDKINIQLDKINQKTIVSILDVSGREVQKNHFENTKELELNTKNLAKGLYSIKLETDGETNYYKVVKE